MNDSTPTQNKAKRYQRIKIQLTLVSIALDLIALLVLLLTGLSGALSDTVESWTANAYLQVLIYFAILGSAWEAISFPFDYWQGYRIEKRFDLSNQSFFGWLWDWWKSLGISAVMGLAVMEIVYALLRSTGDDWWWIAALVLVALMVILVQLAPVVFLPIFYKYRPLGREDLKEELMALSERCETPVVGVYEIDLSEKSKATNAALAGWGRTRRILLGDTMLDKFTNEEIKAVMAHELAHHRYGHIWLNIVVQTAVIFLGFFLADLFLRAGVRWFGFDSIADLGAFPMLALAFTFLSLILMVPVNALSRFFERQADRFAGRFAENGQLASALMKLSKQNLADPNPHPLVEFIFYGHPSIGNRLEMLGQSHQLSETDGSADS